MSATTIFLVTGSTGDYSDHRTWIVGAFYDEEQAKARVAEIENEIARLRLRLDGEAPRHFNVNKTRIFAWEETEAIETTLGSLDPHFRSDYTGTGYAVESCELFGAVDTFLTASGIAPR